MAFSDLIDQIEQGSGKFSLDKTYFINNATDMDITVTWSIKEPEARGAGTYHIKAGEKGGPYPQFLAYHIVKELVNREMQREGKAQFFASAIHRSPYEKKFLIEIEGDGTEDPFTAQIREQERRKILEEMKSSPISDAGYTSSESRRKAHKKKGIDDEFEGANRE